MTFITSIVRRPASNVRRPASDVHRKEVRYSLFAANRLANETRYSLLTD